MNNTDRKTARAIDARLARISAAFIEAGILNASKEEKKDFLIRLLMDRQMALTGKNLSDWPDSSSLARYLLLQIRRAEDERSL
jgi:hypothetical protein